MSAFEALQDITLLVFTAALLLAGTQLKPRRLLGPLVIMTGFIALRFLVRPAFLLFGLDEVAQPWLFTEDYHQLVRKAVLIFDVAYLVLILAYVGTAPAMRAIVAGIERTRSQLDTNRLAIAVFLLLSAFSAYMIVIFLRAGSLTELVSTARGDLFEGRSYLKDTPVFTCYLAAALLLERLLVRRASFSTIALFIWSQLLLLAIGERVGLIILLATVMVYNFSVRRVKLGVVVALVVATLVLGTLAGELRSEARRENTDISEGLSTDKTLTRRITNGVNLDVFDHLLVIVQDYGPGRASRDGQDFVSGTVALVPRAIWPGKPESITPGSWFVDEYLPGKQGGAPFTPIGEWWANFGWLGIILGFMLSGALLRLVAEALVSRKIRPATKVLACAFFLNVTGVGLLHAGVLANLALVGFPIALVLLLCLRSRPQGAANRRHELEGPVS